MITAYAFPIIHDGASMTTTPFLIPIALGIAAVVLSVTGFFASHLGGMIWSRPQDYATTEDFAMNLGTACTVLALAAAFGAGWLL